MSTCDSCRHWNREWQERSCYGPEMPLSDLYGECDNPKLNARTDAAQYTKSGDARWLKTTVFKKTVRWDMIKEKFGNRMEREDDHSVPLDQAFPDAADTHGIGFHTGPKFGCIHHEPKEP